MDVRLGDILVMKKEHPCGDKRWLVLRTGMDFRLRCLGCGHPTAERKSKPNRTNERSQFLLELRPLFCAAETILCPERAGRGAAHAALCRSAFCAQRGD